VPLKTNAYATISNKQKQEGYRTAFLEMSNPYYKN